MQGTTTNSHEVTDFEQDVIEASRRGPVLVDFWAAWCGPCRALGPILEKLANENEGQWSLVKVNTDMHPEVSARYRIRGIPAVKLFVDGQVADEFTGALPEHAVRQWLEKAIPSESKRMVEEAERSMDAGDDATATRLLEAVLRSEPGNPKARVLMARLLVFSDPKRALSLVDGAAFAGPVYQQTAEAVRTLAAMEEEASDVQQLPEEPGREDYFEALQATRRGDYDGAFEHLINVLKSNRYYHDDAARRAGVALFTLLGDRHEVTRRHRRMFDMWLY